MRFLIFLSIVPIVSLVAGLLELDVRQTVSLTVFLVFIYGTLLFWKFRLAFAFLGITILLALGLIDVPTFVRFAGIDIFLFLMSMMIVIGFLEERRFFEYVIERVVALVGPRGYGLIAVMMMMSALFAALVDEVTSILFMAATMIHLALRFKLNPIPFVILLIFATNIGSSATVVGNPVGVIIALRAGLTFTDFLRWASPIAIMALAVAIPLSMLYFRRDIRLLDERLKVMVVEEGGGAEVGRAVASSKDLIVSALVFIGTITSLVLHHHVEEALHLKTNSMLIATVLGAASLTLLIDRERAKELVAKRVDWWTLTFFMLLFASVGTLSFVGVTGKMAGAMVALPLGETTLLMLFSWMAALLSAFMDNVLAVATLIPVVEELGMFGVATYPFWWSALFAGTFFGNLTLIGSTANIIAVGMIERRKLGNITLREWIRPGALVSIPTFALASILIMVQIPLMPR